MPYVPGWDCHGLPIEHKVMTDLVESGKYEKLAGLEDSARRMAIRRECAKHAEKYIKLQSGQFQRLLTLADYAKPYLTMQPAYEAAVLEVLLGLHEQGLVYRALKPVHWSVANETALADAELEYADREDLSVYVDFEAADGEAVYDAFGLPAHAEALDGEDEEADEAAARGGVGLAGRPGQRPCFMIWTTTPWTLPANVAIAVNERFEYALVRVDGNVTVMALDAVERVTKAAQAEDVRVLATAPGSKLVGLRYRHPFVGAGNGVGSPGFEGVGAEAAFRVVGAEYVTLEDGTGLVHTAPGHGIEDYQTGLKHGLPVYCPVLGNGKYDATAPEWLRGVDVWKANGLVVEHLRRSGHLFHDHTFMHSYPHDWRSKTPTIFRCTEQWFVGVDRATKRDGRTLREMALGAVGGGEESVRFVPDWGRNRMRGMLESRPDWCISRQRAWGLPIPAFVTGDGRTVMTAAMMRRVIDVVRSKGSDAWFQMTPTQLLEGYDPGSDVELSGVGPGFVEGLRKGGDILDVWFESGSSWNAVLRERGLGFPAELYLEGSDQHRGWFQLSLLPALGATGRPPFRTLLTHGFMVGKDGRKLSKSKGDTIEKLFDDYGVDVLRWWVAGLSYENDVKVDREFFDAAGEGYRKVRNTIRFMLSNLAGYTGGRGENPEARTLEAWVLSEFEGLRSDVVSAYERYDFRAATTALYEFCNTTLSAVYLAAIKDRLYCDRKDSARRVRTQAALWRLTDGLCRLLAPVLVHTADEAFRLLHAGEGSCVHLEEFPAASGVQADASWREAMESRKIGLLALERVRGQGGVENPLDAQLTLPDREGLLARLDAADLADLLGVSRVRLEAGVGEAVVTDLRGEPRCERSWKRDGTVRSRSDGGLLSDRDAEAVGV